MTDEDLMDQLETLLARPEPDSSAPSPHTLRRLAAGDLPGEEGATLRGALSESERDRLRGLEAADAAFLAAHPFSSVAGELHSRAAEIEEPRGAGVLGRWLQVRSLLWSVAAAAVALALLWGMPKDGGPGGAPGPGGNQLKGATTLLAFGELDGLPTRLEPGATLAPGDRLQFTVTTTRTHLALLGVDGTGTVSRYLPVGGELSAPFAPGNGRPLPDALTLDDAPGPEVFVVFLSEEALPLAELEQALHDAVDGGDPLALLSASWRDVRADVGVFWARKESLIP